MLLSIFSFLYEIIIGENYNYPEYRDGIFSTVGLITFIISVVTCLIYYLGLGRWKPFFHQVGHWIIAFVITISLCFGLAFSIANDELGESDGYMIRFALVNSLYSLIYFLIFSLIVKRFSIFAKRTPF